MPLTWTGTAHFLSEDAACTYYRIYGYDRLAVRSKIKAGEIFIGPPETAVGESLTLIDGGTRYAVKWTGGHVEAS